MEQQKLSRRGFLGAVAKGAAAAAGAAALAPLAADAAERTVTTGGTVSGKNRVVTLNADQAVAITGGFTAEIPLEYDGKVKLPAAASLRNTVDDASLKVILPDGSVISGSEGGTDTVKAGEHQLQLGDSARLPGGASQEIQVKEAATIEVASDEGLQKTALPKGTKVTLTGEKTKVTCEGSYTTSMKKEKSKVKFPLKWAVEGHGTMTIDVKPRGDCLAVLPTSQYILRGTIVGGEFKGKIYKARAFLSLGEFSLSKAADAEDGVLKMVWSRALSPSKELKANPVKGE